MRIGLLTNTYHNRLILNEEKSGRRSIRGPIEITGSGDIPDSVRIRPSDEESPDDEPSQVALDEASQEEAEALEYIREVQVEELKLDLQSSPQDPGDIKT